MKVTPELVSGLDRSACRPGYDWLVSKFPEGIDLDVLVGRLVEEQHGDWIGWLAVSLPVSKEKMLVMADLATPEARGYMAINAKGLSMDERLSLVKRSTPALIGTFLKKVPGAPASLIEMLDTQWTKKINRMIERGILRLS